MLEMMTPMRCEARTEIVSIMVEDEESVKGWKSKGRMRGTKDKLRID